MKGKPFASKIYISLFASISLLVHWPDSIDESKCWHWLHIDLDSRKGHFTKSCTKGTLDKKMNKKGHLTKSCTKRDT